MLIGDRLAYIDQGIKVRHLIRTKRAPGGSLPLSIQQITPDKPPPLHELAQTVGESAIGNYLPAGPSIGLAGIGC